MNRPTPPFVSVIVPCRNEEQHIGRCLESILASDYPHDRMELLVVDGMSTDRTRELVAWYAARHPVIRLLDNPRRIAPSGLNLGIQAARGEVILRMDAHVIYLPSYLPILVRALLERGADNVGGVLETLPGADTPVARAIALGLAHPLGVGNSYFRVGAPEPRWVDTVAFGCFRREAFERAGLFDEELVRNQDDEFNFRLIRRGGRVLLMPTARAYYVARRSLRQLWRMYFQYGYFKPLVARKVGKVMTLRQLVPALFVTTLAMSGLAAVWWRPAALAGAAVAAAYAAAVLVASARAAPRHGLRVAAALALVFPVLHVGYGVGFLLGLRDHLLRPRKQTPELSALPMSR
ncbi:MAG TPA: glycosyltransferase family 2 protein [Gemmatimonadales bacterium]|nr:glycosyltransferase family 2 protein [Gemmatimonadales bacterium]